MEKLKNKKVRGHAAEDQNQIRASRVSRTIVSNQSQKWPEIEYMPTSNSLLQKISNSVTEGWNFVMIDHEKESHFWD